VTGSTIAGVVCLLLACLAAYIGWSAKTSAQVLEDTPRTQAGNVSKSGYYEVQGKVMCESPLQAPRDQRPCVWYRHVITEEIEEHYTDSQNRRCTRRRTRTILDETQGTLFQIEDNTGQVACRPDGADIQGHGSSRRHRHEQPLFGSLFESFTRWGSPDRTLGQNEKIEALFVGDFLYAIGQIDHHPGGLTMGPDKQGGRPFMLSIHSEEEILARKKLTYQVAGIAAVVLGILGPLLLFRGL
jgi:hypothetical protein